MLNIVKYWKGQHIICVTPKQVNFNLHIVPISVKMHPNLMFSPLILKHVDPGGGAFEEREVPAPSADRAEGVPEVGP